MRWILHRGNKYGPGSCENNPKLISEYLLEGYEIEIDLWYKDNLFYLGHDLPSYKVNEDFLEQCGLWIHCKDAKTLEYMVNNKNKLHYFYHTNEDYILTSRGIVWSNVGKSSLKNSVIVMPEKAISEYNWEVITNNNCIICSDYLIDYIKNLLIK
jgi:hypothetical protein